MKNKFVPILLATFSFLFYVNFAFAGSATVNWNANTESDLAGYKIYYGTSARTGTDPKVCGLCGYANTINAGNVLTYALNNLTDGVTYYFSVSALDTSNNESTFSAEVSKALPLALPLISNLVGSGTTQNSIQISWNTNIPTNGQVFYGLTASYVLSSSLLDNTTKTTIHSTTLSSLSPSTLYHFKVTSIDASNNPVSSSDFTFTTLALPSPVISSFTSSPTSITSGQSATLSWSVSGATSISINQGVGAVVGTSKVVSPTVTTTYTLTATNAGGSATAQVTVSVNSVAPPTSTSPAILSFIATPSSVTAGNPSTLSWVVTGNPAPAVSLNNGFGTQSGTSLSISPFQTTAYTLTASNSAGTATAQSTVVVSTAASSGGTNTSSGGGGGGGGGGTSSIAGTTVYIPPAVSAVPCSASKTSYLTRNLYKTIKGDDVKILQSFLISQKYLAATSLGTSNATGFFGLMTEKAVQAFQKANGIVSSGTFYSTGYGNVGPTTRAKINPMLSGASCTGTSASIPSLQDQIKALQTQVNALLLKLQQMR
jgi:hypothetical protein